MYPDFLKIFQKPRSNHPHEAIRESVEVLLNARAGALPYPSTFGAPDFRDSISTEYAEKFKAMLLNQIRRNEPRIKQVLCDSINTKIPLESMRYALQVTLKTEELLDLSIETTGAGKFHVHITCH